MIKFQQSQALTSHFGAFHVIRKSEQVIKNIFREEITFPDERMLLQLTESLAEPHCSSAKSVSKNAFLMKASSSSSTSWVLSLRRRMKVLERLWKAGILLSYPGIVLTITHVFWHPYLLPA